MIPGIMELIPIQVECYSGYKADEYPKKFIWNHIDFEILEITDRWFEAYQHTTSCTVNYFKVKTNLAGNYMLRHEIQDNRWFLVI